MRDLEQEVMRHQILYDAGKPEISDKEFDALVEKLRKKLPNSPVLDVVGTRVLKEGVEHKTPMLSLQKTKRDEGVISWLGTFSEPAIIITPKYDGLAISIYYKNRRMVAAATRGDGHVGDDVTRNVRHVQGVPVFLPKHAPDTEFWVRGEVLFPRNAEALREYSSARNAAAGVIMKKEADKRLLSQLKFIAYECSLPTKSDSATEQLEQLDSLGFAGCSRVTAKHLTTAGTKKAINTALEEFSSPDFDFECDGIVIKYDSLKRRKELGETRHHPKWALALKFTDKASVATLEGVQWQVSRSGTVTPVAVVEPIQLGGVTVSRATLHNYQNFMKLNLRYGDRLSMTRRGGVIPHVEEVVARGIGKKLKAPKQCPKCQDPLVVIDSKVQVLRCDNAECPSRLTASVLHWCKTINALGWGPEIIQKLYDEGIVDNVEDLYDIDEDDISPIFGEKISKKLMKELRKKSTMKAAVFLAALGIPGVGKTQAEKALASFDNDIDSLFDELEEDNDGQAVEHLLSQKVGPAVASSLVSGLLDNSAEILAIREYITIEGSHNQPVASGPFSGEKVVFTGKLSDMERSEAQDMVRELGGEAANSITKDVTLLVVGDGAKEEQRTKRDKAEKYGIKTISEQEFIEMITASKDA